MMTFGSLFAGIGGLDLGLERAGMKCVWQVENNEYATRVLEKHWPDVRRWGDVATFPPAAAGSRQQAWDTNGIRTVLRPEVCPGPSAHGGEWYVDLICGGFPCQPVSTAGRRRGDDDERWLWDEMRRVCAVLRPAWVLAENVLGLLSAGNVRGELFGRVVRDLAALGYRVRWDCIPAAAVGAPHIRDRVFIVGVSDSNGRETGQQAESTPGHGRAIVATGAGAMADADGVRARQQPEAIQAGQREPCDDGPDVPDTASLGGQGRRQCGRVQLTEDGKETGDAGWWSTEPDVGRVADGVPSRVDRLRCLGNAVVPQVAEYIGRRILEAP